LIALPPTRTGAPYPWFVAIVLAVAYAVAFIDRQILNLLVDPIKKTLMLTDTAFSLLQGLAFVAAYVAMGVVFGRLADQSNRRNLLALGVTIWSVFTALCGTATGFGSFFGARAGIGAAEACLLPAGWSMLADYFDRERLPRAMSIFLIGPFVGGGLALIFGGLLFKHVGGSFLARMLPALEPWRPTFVAVGIPGIVIAVLLLLVVREPPRHVALQTSDRRFTLNETVRFLWKERAFYGSFFGGVALLVVGLYALPAWTPALLMRAHGGSPATVGLQYGSATLIAGSFGVLLGPWIARRLGRHFPSDAPVRTAMIAAVGAAPACLLLPFAPSYWTALLASAAASCCLNFTLPVAPAALQASTPNRMRGLVTSAYAFVLTTTGLSVAATLIAVVTDRVFGDPAKIGSALASLPLLRAAARHYAARIGAVRDAE
jgi:MFS family permease